MHFQLITNYLILKIQSDEIFKIFYFKHIKLILRKSLKCSIFKIFWIIESVEMKQTKFISFHLIMKMIIEKSFFIAFYHLNSVVFQFSFKLNFDNKWVTIDLCILLNNSIISFYKPIFSIKILFLSFNNIYKRFKHI
jgi:hypothetical protein